jgi:hypothetical protein
MNNDDLNRLSNELLTCYFDNAGAIEMGKIAQKYRVPVGGKIFNKAVERGIGWLESGDSSQLNETNKSKIFQQGIQGISKKFGATLGKDFSMAPDGGMFVNNELMNKIMTDLPPEALAEFKDMGYIKSVAQDPFEMLEKHLGVPFFTKLEAVSKLRLATLNDAKACEYVGFLGGGLQNKHDWISIEYCVSFFHRTLGADRFKRVMSHPGTDETDSDENDSDDGIIGSLVFEDLLTALGRDSHSDDELGAVVSIEDLMALDKVFRGERFSCAELAEGLRRVQDKHRKNK